MVNILELVQAAAALIDQVEMSAYTDDIGHDLRCNKAYIDLKKNVRKAGRHGKKRN